jgi:hypothetical protein
LSPLTFQFRLGYRSTSLSCHHTMWISRAQKQSIIRFTPCLSIY